MLKLAAAMLAVALAGAAGADDWRDLRVDASSEAAYQRSLAVFNAELSPARQSVFSAALVDIWLQGTKQAQENQEQYTVGAYYQQLHGLSYEEVVTFTDPTGETAKMRYRDANRAHVASTSPPVSPWQNPYRGVIAEESASALTSPNGRPQLRPKTGWSSRRGRGFTQPDTLPPARSASGQPCGADVC